MSLATRSLLVSCLSVALAGPIVAQESRALLDAPLVVLPGDNRIQHLVDFDRDGRVDLLSWWYTNSSYNGVRVRGWRNLPDDTFAEAWQVAFSGPWTTHAAAHLAAGDVDGDGVKDFAIDYRREIRVYAVNGLAAPTFVQSILVDADIGDLALEDWNGDGLADLIYREKDALVRVHANGGASQGFQQTEVGSHDAGSPLSVMRVGELDGDGVLDLLFVYANAVHLVPIDGSGSVNAPQVITTASTWSYPRPMIGDVDGDGDQDAIVFDGYGTGHYELLRRTGPSGWSLEPTQVGGPVTELADLDGDGDLDGICCGGGGSFSTWLNVYGSTFNVAFNDGTGAFTPAFQMNGVGSTHIAGAADVDLDGDVDLVAGRCIYYARGPLTHSPFTTLATPEASDQALVDYDDDGDFDMNLGPTSVLQSNGQTGFASTTTKMPAAPVGSTYFGPGIPGDFDGDGDVDLIVSRFDDGSFAHMRLMRNEGAGHYVDGGAAAGPGEQFSCNADLAIRPRDSFVQDLDLDGDMDLITRASHPTSSDKSKFWRNVGNGFFTLTQTKTGDGVIAVGELTGDGIPDIVGTVSFATGNTNAYWQPGNGDCTFSNGFYFSTYYYAGESTEDTVTISDLDGDGDNDIAAIDNDGYGSGELYYWRNNGTAGFTNVWLHPGWFFTNYGVGQHVLHADVDGDGWKDLVCWPPVDAARGAQILLRTADGAGYQPPFTQAVQPLAFRDVDGDGDQDAIARFYNNSESQLVRNRTIDGASSGSRRQYGVGSLGTGDRIPLLGAVGPFLVGEPAQLRIRGGVGGANVLLAIGLVEANIANKPFQGMNAYVWPVKRRLALKLLGPVGVAGAGYRDLNYTVSPDLAGLTYYHQAYVFDAGAANGISCSNGLEISYD